MNPVKLSPDDPKLTAYALGELDPKEGEVVAAAIQNDPSAKRVVSEIRALSSKLQGALANEPIEGLPPASAPMLSRPVPGKVIPFPYYIAAGAVAACFAVVFGLRTDPAPTVSVAQLAPKAAVTPSSDVVAAPVTSAEAIAAVDVARYRRLPTENVSDIRPAPAVQGGLRLGKSVVSNDAVSSPRNLLSPSMTFGRSSDPATSGVQPFDKAGSFVGGVGRSLASLVQNNKASTWADSTPSWQTSPSPYGSTAYAQTRASRVSPAEMQTTRSDKLVTASYEVVPVQAGELVQTGSDPLPYASLNTNEARARESLTLKVRYAVPTVDINRKIEIPLIDPGADFSKIGKDFKFASAVAGFEALLNESPHRGTATYDEVLKWAQESRGASDAANREKEFIELIKKSNAAVE